MKQVSLLLILFVLVSLPFMYVEGATKSKTYIHEDIGFSFEYPFDYEEEATQTPQEVARFVKPNEYKLPVFTAKVRTGSDTDLTDLPDTVIATMKESIPNTDNYSVDKERSVKLGDGSEAIMFTFTWEMAGGDIVMETVIVGAYKGDNLITVSGTTIRGLDISLKQISKYCMTLKLVH